MTQTSLGGYCKYADTCERSIDPKIKLSCEREKYKNIIFLRGNFENRLYSNWKENGRRRILKIKLTSLLNRL